MIYSKEIFYKQGIGQTNEDRYVYNDESLFFSVIDGATPLEKGSISGSFAADIVQKTLSNSKEQNVFERLKEANLVLGKKISSTLNKNIETIDNLSKELRSSCGCIAVQIIVEKGSIIRLDYAHVGDCMLFVQYDNGRIRQLTFDHIEKLDQESINIATEFRKKWIKQNNFEEYISAEDLEILNRKVKEHIKTVLIKNRRKLNSKEGYGIIDGSEKANYFIEYGSIPFHNIKKLLLLSDGLQIPLPIEKNEQAWNITAEYAFQNSLYSLGDYVEMIEEKDPNLTKYPRLKKADDKTGILISF
ncbi:protein phosphatase 2C domain-containing protein [Evansella sp. AB-P1]|uniref:protein phosphatase 2C domain-containing protein n=1 Tax=Evansella sp. AB-P1 TaxID=3037653 RepID=UPI00241E7A76|nr:protein phosphatase 2C domain-containing protein [Evansella sp. AB-P1]MDG5787993.1 protein phosphatase 2C domain-containing protein [Evansella sp. AB-P1]